MTGLMNKLTDSPAARTRSRSAAARNTLFTSSTPLRRTNSINSLSYQDLETNSTCSRTENKAEGSQLRNKSIQEVKSGLLDASMADEEMKYEDIVEEAGMLIDECGMSDYCSS